MADAKREWLSVEDLAEELDIPKKTIYQWNYDGTGPPRHKFGKHIRYRRREVDQWSATHKVPGRQ